MDVKDRELQAVFIMPTIESAWEFGVLLPKVCAGPFISGLRTAQGVAGAFERAQGRMIYEVLGGD